jgi:hypothetical protein
VGFGVAGLLGIVELFSGTEPCGPQEASRGRDAHR